MKTALIHIHLGEVVQVHVVHNADSMAGTITGNLQTPDGPETRFRPDPCRMMTDPQTGLPLFGIRDFPHLWMLAHEYRQLCVITL